MTWFLFSLANAFFESVKDVFGKQGAGRASLSAVALGQRLFALPLLLPLALLWGGAWPTNTAFWLATLGSVALNTATSLLYIRALRDAPLSQALPVVALSPTFVLITGPLINRELPNALGVLGVLVATFGAYLLNADQRGGGWLQPFTHLWQHAGLRSMLLVAILWSITAPLDKLAVQHADPLWYAAVANTLLVFTLLPFLFRSGIPQRRVLPSLAVLGLASGLSFVAQMVAFSMTLVPYALSVKRLSALFGVGWGKVLFREQHIRQRLLGAGCITTGAIVVLLSTA